MAALSGATLVLTVPYYMFQLSNVVVVFVTKTAAELQLTLAGCTNSALDVLLALAEVIKELLRTVASVGIVSGLCSNWALLYAGV